MAFYGGVCIDRYEVHAVDKKTRLPLSPFYPPERVLLQKVYRYWSSEASRTGSERARQQRLPPVPAHQRKPFEPLAVSAPGKLPQGYFTYYSAKKACHNAGKRLCSEREWVAACKGTRRSQHPYGQDYRKGVCNVFRPLHPAYELHGNSSLGHLDPRLHLVVEEGRDPLLRLSGASAGCVSQLDDDRIYDMEGNLDEWVDDPEGVFLGGFFSRPTKEGCEARVSSHSPLYTDYSLGVRCCQDPR